MRGRHLDHSNRPTHFPTSATSTLALAPTTMPPPALSRRGVVARLTLEVLTRCVRGTAYTPPTAPRLALAYTPRPPVIQYSSDACIDIDDEMWSSLQGPYVTPSYNNHVSPQLPSVPPGAPSKGTNQNMVFPQLPSVHPGAPDKGSNHNMGSITQPAGPNMGTNQTVKKKPPQFFYADIALNCWKKARVIQAAKMTGGGMTPWGILSFIDSEGQFGWELDHIAPYSKGGLSILFNCQVLQWAVNRSKAAKLRFSKSEMKNNSPLAVYTNKDFYLYCSFVDSSGYCTTYRFSFCTIARILDTVEKFVYGDIDQRGRKCKECTWLEATGRKELPPGFKLCCGDTQDEDYAV